MHLNKLNEIKFDRKNLFIVFFILFSFLSAIFCNFSHVNNALHASIVFFIFAILSKENIRKDLFAYRKVNIALGFIIIFLLYYSLSTLWSTGQSSVFSNLKHSIYLYFYILIGVYLINSNKRMFLLSSIFCGFFIFGITAIYLSRHGILTNRLTPSSIIGPDNVIDTGGLFAISILIGLILIRDTKKYFLILPTLFLAACLILTQSRGPIISLLIAFSCLIKFRVIFNSHRRHKNLCLAITYILFFCLFVFLLEHFFHIFYRFYFYKQYFLRLNIWLHTLEVIKTNPIFGFGFDKKLAYTIALDGEFITSTHSIYFGSLLIGGIFGFSLFILMLAYIANLARQSYKYGFKLESISMVFMLCFILTQGTFLIGNPNSYWYLFWFIIILQLGTSARQTKNQRLLT